MEGTDSHAPALVRAYELLEASQAEHRAAEVADLLAVAEDRDWPDVAFVLHYAGYSYESLSGRDGSEHLERMWGAARAADDPALVATTFAHGAESALRLADAGVREVGERDLARAVALLDERGGSATALPSALIACAQAYHFRGLWELEEELYERAAALLDQPWPPELVRIRDLSRLVVTLNRHEAQLALACALMEIGEREAAREQAARRYRLAHADLERIPERWWPEIVAVEEVHRAVAGEPASAVYTSLLEQLRGSVYTGYGALVPLATAIRCLDRGDVEQAAGAAEHALPGMDPNRTPSPYSLAMAIASLAPPHSGPARRYAQALARQRWDARQELLGAARRRIDAERVLLDNERLTHEAFVDDLTGLANRRAYERHLARLVHERSERPVAVLLADVDHFKAVNDTYGHAVGDEVLRRVARLIVDMTRPSDLAVRTGGDEFLVLLHGCGHFEAARRAQDLVDAVARQSWNMVGAHPVTGDALAISVSVGVDAGSARDVGDLVETADARMYHAKAAGRGRAVHG